MLIIIIFLNNFLLHSQSLTYARCITLKQQYVPHTNTNTPAMILTYDRVLSVIEKALWKLVEEYQGVRRSLQDLVEGQERNMAQLERIGAIIEQRWSLKGVVGKEKSGNDVVGSKNGSGESQEKRTLSSTSC